MAFRFDFGLASKQLATGVGLVLCPTGIDRFGDFLWAITPFSPESYRRFGEAAKATREFVKTIFDPAKDIQGAVKWFSNPGPKGADGKCPGHGATLHCQVNVLADEKKSTGQKVLATAAALAGTITVASALIYDVGHTALELGKHGLVALSSTEVSIFGAMSLWGAFAALAFSAIGGVMSAARGIKEACQEREAALNDEAFKKLTGDAAVGAHAEIQKTYRAAVSAAVIEGIGTFIRNGIKALLIMAAAWLVVTYGGPVVAVLALVAATVGLFVYLYKSRSEFQKTSEDHEKLMLALNKGASCKGSCKEEVVEETEVEGEE